MGRFITKIDKENKFVTVTDTKTGKKITERYHDGRPAKVAANEMEQDLLLPERRPPASDERQTAMSLMGIASPQSQIKMDNAMFLSDQAMKSSTGNAATSPIERAKVGTTQSLSQPAPSGESIKDMPEMGAEMSSKLAMDALRNRQKKINKESSNAPVSAKALGDYSGLSEDEIKKHEASQNPPWQKARNVLGEKQGFMDRLEENERNQAQKVAGLKKIYDEADPEEQEYIENSPSLGGSEKLDFLKDLGGESVGSGPEWGNPYEGGEAVSSTSVTRNEKGQILGNRGRSSHRGGPNKAQIGEMLYDQGFGGEAVSSSTSPYLEHGKGEAPSEEQLKKAGRNPAHSMFNTPEEYERLAKEEASFLKELGGESISPDEVATLQVEERKSWDADPSTLEETTLKFDAEKPVPKKIAELPREEKTAAKEANGTHVRDEATGFTLNLSRLKKSFKRQERFAMLKHVPKENRAAMLAEWGYIDPDELTVAQKKSALDIQKLKNAELQGAAFQIELDRAEKNVGQSLTPVQEKQFNMLRDQHKEASKEKPPNWALMKSIDEELGGIHSSFKSKNRDYEKMEKQYWGNQKKEAAKIPAIARLNKQFDMPDSKYYFDTIQTLERDFTKSVKGKSATQFLNIPIGGSNPAFAGQDSQPESATTVENYFKNEGLPTWRNVKERLSLDATNPEIAKANAALAKKMNIKSLDGMSEPQYMQWATSKVKSEILRRRLGSYHIGMQNLLHRNVVEKENILNNPKAVDEENSKPTEAPEIPDPTKVEPPEAISTEEYSEDIPLEKDLTRPEKSLLGKDFFEAPPETSNMQRSVDRNLFSDLRMGKITKEEFLEKVSSPGWYTQRYGLNKKLKRSFDELK